MGLEGFIRVIVAFIFVVLLVLAVAWIARKLGLEKRLRSRLSKEGDGVQVEDIFYLDSKRRIVTVARGTQKHLLLLGPHTDMVLEHFEGDAMPKKGDDDDA